MHSYGRMSDALCDDVQFGILCRLLNGNSLCEDVQFGILWQMGIPALALCTTAKAICSDTCSNPILQTRIYISLQSINTHPAVTFSRT